MALELASSRTYPVPVERAFDAVLPAPLPYLFARRYGAIPAIREVRDQTGIWGLAGQTRSILLADRSTMRETLLEVDRPRSFSYELSDIHGLLFRPLFPRVEGEWSFEPAGTGVRITWAWTVHPGGRLGRAALPVLARLWQGYARQALEQIERLLVPVA